MFYFMSVNSHPGDIRQQPKKKEEKKEEISIVKMHCKKLQ